MGRFINPFTDVEFKRIFGQEMNKDFFMNFTLKGKPEKLKTDIVLADRDTHEPFTDKLRFIFIELPSFNKDVDECETDFECWIYVLKNMDKLERLPFKARKAVFEKLEQIVDIAALSKEERMMYDESVKVYRDTMAAMAFAKQEGREEGRAEGREEAEQSIAWKMKAQGISPDVIATCTGLSMDEISAL